MKMTTGIERVFRPLNIRGYTGPQIYREIYMHYLHFLNEDGTVQKSKLDKMIEGKFFKEATVSLVADGSGGVGTKSPERSLYGEVIYQFPDGQTKRLLALGTDMHGQPVLPQT